MRDVDVIADPASAVTALDPLRARLLAELREPASASTLAGRLGLPRQRVNYHLRLLEKHGLVEAAGERTWGGLTERHFVATAAGYVVSPEALGAAASAPRAEADEADRMSAAYVVALAARVVAEVGGMARTAVRQRKRLPVYGLDTAVRFSSPADRAAFAEELTAAVNRLASKYHDERTPNGRWQRLTISMHPVPKGVDPGTPSVDAAEGRGHR
ncbi:Helix-turn-helix domain-containing protein [Actinopolymorpha cephalotaxi]|uniref:DNA-binding transcriptional ArsR family regulator n=1 Tax=Actinopolymorpha cephalotaxi TaxID=504797 RepID=A0A1I2XBQ4_9ACTN|nr:helix-turn-helix domain-containing protein [Actinopolymorpha cephalotaxi]NYH86168.1 DNA-binding transcriptional ArsR family regulator [Actinopolymorpha cephalotaxi]SFH10950.1 Helix-turn-helix domain-containing protein [Actinopolymorpha cephalotaxi]